MTLNLFDSSTRQITPFEPLVPGQVSLYVCGPTTQSSPHLGHLRTFLAFDVLVRWLERSGYAVTYVRNVTDIDDKILAKSKENDAEWWAWSLTHEREFTRIMDTFGARRPDYEPRATGHVTEMIAFMQRLIDNGHAYADGNGNVYFSVTSFDRYGQLTRQDVADMVDAEDQEPGKRDPRDFALWKQAKPDEPETAAWDTPWGRGRPGWHLECSAMSKKYVGETFDIHGGGLDLRFPHHENEQAQSWAAGYGFAKRWVHSGLVTVDGLKMGKSLNNFVTAEDALAKYPAAAIRLALVSGHYRSVVEFNEKTMSEAQTVWQRMTHAIRRAEEALAANAGVAAQTAAETTVSAGTTIGAGTLKDVVLPEKFVAAMDDDLNAAEAFAVIHNTLTQLNSLLNAKQIDYAALAETVLQLRAMLDVFGLDPHAPANAAGSLGESAEAAALDALVKAQLEARAAARAEKDWSKADEIRDLLQGAGIKIEDGATGASWSIDTSRKA